ncbi:hypothetical protein [Nocardia transvalensis]|uniref:hypothetical protein n=1 Tax=Nocardia transvalensis TaxID=37333 RepID=UPI00189536FB|nr:hypothetical protein [Nocardia transvalensis]MBF6332793.1 hypothetical protein [Nocardia transvalensis]
MTNVSSNDRDNGLLEHADTLLTAAQHNWTGATADSFGRFHTDWQTTAAQLRDGLDRIYAAATTELEVHHSRKRTDNR